MTPRSFFYLILAFIISFVLALIIISLPALKHDRLCRNNPTAAECVVRK
jgi:hypothetical protein